MILQSDPTQSAASFDVPATLMDIAIGALANRLQDLAVLALLIVVVILLITGACGL